MGFVIRKKTSAEPTTSYGLREQAPGVGTTDLSQTRQPAQAGPWITVCKREGPSTLSQVARGASAGTQALRFAGDPSLGGGVGLLGAAAPWLTSDPKKLQAIQAGTKAYGIGKVIVKRAGADKMAGLGGLGGMTSMAPGAAPFLAEATGGAGMLYKMPQWAGGGGGVSSVGAGAPAIKAPPAKASWGQYAGKAFSYLSAAITGAQALKGIVAGEKGAYASAAMSAATMAPSFAGGASAAAGGAAFAAIALASWAIPKLFGSSHRTRVGGDLAIEFDPELNSRFKLTATGGLGPARNRNYNPGDRKAFEPIVAITKASLYPYICMYNMMSSEQQAEIARKIGAFNVGAHAKGSTAEHVTSRFKSALENISDNIQKKLDPVFAAVLTSAQKAYLQGGGQDQGRGFQIMQRSGGQSVAVGSDPIESIWPGLSKKYDNRFTQDTDWNKFTPLDVARHGHEHPLSPFDVSWGGIAYPGGKASGMIYAELSPSYKIYQTEASRAQAAIPQEDEWLDTGWTTPTPDFAWDYTIGDWAKRDATTGEWKQWKLIQ